MVNRVLDEQFRTRLHPAQQAFITSKDISRNLVMLQSTFRDTFRDYQHILTDELLLVLSLDCSKAYNHTA